jgi:hypothetical protein
MANPGKDLFRFHSNQRPVKQRLGLRARRSDVLH